ncbi:MAG: transcription-repair coupling factor [Bryobacteraceae bacterium]
MTHPEFRDLLAAAARHPSFRQLLRRIESEAAPQQWVTGLTPTAAALYAVLLYQFSGKPLIVITAGQAEAELVLESATAFFNVVVSASGADRPQLLPEWDVVPHQGLSPHSAISQQRAVAFWRLATSHAPLTVVPVRAALIRTEEPEFYRQLALSLQVGEEVPFEQVAEHLAAIGYQRRDPVEMVGEFCVRGGILDVFSPESPRPVRIEFLGDLVESIRLFDVATQRSVLKTDHCTLLPMQEIPKTPALLAQIRELAGRPAAPGEELEFPGWEFWGPLARPRTSSLASFQKSAVTLWLEPQQLSEAACKLWERLEQEGSSPICPAGRMYLRWDELLREFEHTPQVFLTELALDAPAEPLEISTRPSTRFHGNMRAAAAEVRSFLEGGGRAVFFAPARGELERLADIFQEYSVPFQIGSEGDGISSGYLASRVRQAGLPAGVFLAKGRIRHGTVLSEPLLAIFGWEDLFDAPEWVSRPAERPLGAFSADLADLKPGDLVVHSQHGIGRFLGLREIAQGEGAGEYLLLEYAGGAKLYVPLTRMDLVQRFRGAGDGAPPLDKLGGVTWERTKKRVKARMRDMAEELLKLYAERKLAQGFRFSPDSNWQREFEDAFEFTETPDQLKAIRDIKRDMESDQPMERLLCGDVGFGKTEVAMRAAFKALGDGRQVAVLAPTTVLAFQHYETFRRRFAPFPVRVEMLSRLVPAKQRAAILEDLAAGKVDILIGTHRLLSKDVQFADLGLLIVDEEQRFGVVHKERLKQLKKNVDVLTMTATPIPRTLHMSLVGLRDMSVIETPPKDRLAIHTVVARFDPALIRAAIEQELSRGGQVYFVHNRVDTIWSRAAEIQQLVPHCRIRVGHGQMSESQLEQVMLAFMRHECDLLVSTTIVENGLDIPLANTIIIENAQNYGLSELYQLRGRVGRSNRRGYAYLLVPPDTELTEMARKRLAALKEFSELGAGFKIAALDLELRGAGNLLGGEQHGHINAVGFDMYVKLLEETVQELRGEPVRPEVRASLSLGLDLRIPADYISEEHQRLRVYRRLAEASTREQAEQILEELEDRYGPAPQAVRDLAEFSLLKSAAESLGIESVECRQGFLNLKFHPGAPVSPGLLMDLLRRTPGAQFTPAAILRLPVDGRGAQEVMAGLRACLEQLKAA